MFWPTLENGQLIFCLRILFSDLPKICFVSYRAYTVFWPTKFFQNVFSDLPKYTEYLQIMFSDLPKDFDSLQIVFSDLLYDFEYLQIVCSDLLFKAT